MELKQIKQRGTGKFILRYDLEYCLPDGREKVYEMVSRRPLADGAELSDSAPEGVVLIVLNPAKSRLLLNREFRPAVNGVIYNFPAGLIDPGESTHEAAARELWEETGLQLSGIFATYGRSYGAVGLSNESSIVVVGEADDAAPFGGNHDPLEEIEPVWVSRAQAEEIIQSGAVTSRVQMFLAMWASDLFATFD